MEILDALCNEPFDIESYRQQIPNFDIVVHFQATMIKINLISYLCIPQTTRHAVLILKLHFTDCGRVNVSWNRMGGIIYDA